MALPEMLAAKLAAPPLPADLVARERLHDRITRGAANRLTLVSAPPGAGKTLLVAAWAAGGHAPGPVAWVTLDGDDDAPAAFWPLIAAALRPWVDVAAGAGPPEEVPHALARALAARPEPLVLVLDDFQEIGDRELLGQVETLVGRPMHGLRLVIITRSDPQLSLHRLRLDGSLTEIRAADLAFTVDEARVLLGQGAAGLDRDALLRLLDRTEGWAAGLRLAALSLERESDPRRFVESFAGSDRGVADYLMGEVLDRLEPDERAFLLRTSVPDVVPADLAAVLGRRPDAARILEDLTRANAFVVRLPGADDVFRYHQLFREFLRAELRRTYPGDVVTLHRMAAAWLANHRQPLRAIHHAVAGNDWEQAALLVARHWYSVVAGGGSPFVRELGRSMPAEAAEREPELALLAAVDRILRGDAEEARRHLDRAVRLGGGLEPEREPGFDALHSFTRLHFAQMAGDLEGVLHATAALPAGARGDEVRAIKLANLASVSAAEGDLDTAEEQLEEALELGRESSAEHVVVCALGGLAFVAAARGGLRDAGRLATDALLRDDALGGPEALETFGAQLALGWVHLHRDELDLAAGRADRAGELARRHGYLAGRVLWGLLASAVLGARGPAGAAEGLRRLRAVREDLAALSRAPFYHALALGLEARLIATRGDSLDQAFAALEREEAAGHPRVSTVAARLLLLAGRPEEALGRLVDVPLEPAAVPLVLSIEALTLQSLAMHETRQPERARAALERALELAAPESYRRVFVDGGPPLAALLREHLRSGVAQRPFAAEVLAAFDRRAPAVDLTGPELIEPLSDREQAVLRYLPTMMSNEEIARTLYVSVNTVKTHLRHLYGKLGASGRRDAVERGRRLNLL